MKKRVLSWGYCINANISDPEFWHADYPLGGLGPVTPKDLRVARTAPELPWEVPMARIGRSILLLLYPASSVVILIEAPPW